MFDIVAFLFVTLCRFAFADFRLRGCRGKMDESLIDTLPDYVLEQCVPLEREGLREILCGPPTVCTATPQPAVAAALMWLGAFLAGSPLADLSASIERTRAHVQAMLPGYELAPDRRAATIKAAFLLESPEVQALNESPWAVAALALPPRSCELKDLVCIALEPEPVETLRAGAFDLAQATQCISYASTDPGPAATLIHWHEAARLHSKGSPPTSVPVFGTQSDAGSTPYERVIHHTLIEFDPTRSRAELHRALDILLDEIEADQQANDSASDNERLAERSLSLKKFTFALQTLAYVQVWGWDSNINRTRVLFDRVKGRNGGAWNEHRTCCCEAFDSRLHRWDAHPWPTLPPTSERIQAPTQENTLHKRFSRYTKHAAALLSSARKNTPISELTLPL